MKAKMYLEFVKIRLWKIAFFPSSTIPYVDTLAIGPFGGLKYDEVDIDDDDDHNEDDILSILTSSCGTKDLYSSAYYDSFDDNIETRTLAAESPSHLSKPMRKNDRNLNLRSGYDSPNESESNRRTSKDGGKSGGKSNKTISLKKLFTVKYSVAYLLDKNATVRR
jgi:hypothetical protein